MPRSIHFTPPLLYRYVFREIASPFLISLFVFTGILFLVRSLKLVELVVNKNVPVQDILMLFSFVIPRFLEIAIPMSLLLGVILAFGRLSADSELIVIRSTGMNFRRLAQPVMAFAAMALLITLATGLWIAPWANYRLGVGIFEIAKMQASAGLQPGVFNEIGQLTIYSQQVNQSDGRMSHVIIADRRDPSLARNFIAKHGNLISDDSTRALTLRLYDGSIHEGSGLDYRLTYFDVNNVNLDESVLSEGGPARRGKKAVEMFLHELNDAIASFDTDENLTKDEQKKLAGFQVQFHRRFAIPVSCFCVALIAMALGIQPSRGGHSWGAAANVMVGIIVILIYYLLFALANALGQQAVLPAWLIVWLPNVLFAWAAIYLFRQVGSERWQSFSQKLGEVFDAVRFRIQALVRARDPG